MDLKCKERSPENTVFEIQRILNEIGLFPVTEWGAKEYEGARCNRVSLFPTRMGQNGKGTEERYALASGYAELMERLQNNWLNRNLRDDELQSFGGFFDAPDEKRIPIPELLAQDNPYLPEVFQRLELCLPWEQTSVLEHLAKACYGLEDGTIPALPYVDFFAGKIVYLPFALITLFGISNGMCAGNSLEEALVQGMSEIYERHVHEQLISGRLCPPEIPVSCLEENGSLELIRQIEADGRFSVSLRDCSLGKGYPALCAIFVDREQGTFGLKIGCHPSFAVAMERTLTEALQGKKLASCTASCRLGTPGYVNSYHNLPNLAKTGNGFYDPVLLSGEPDWDYKPWHGWEGQSNRDFLGKLLAHAKASGYRPLFRDSSHLGFPSYHVVIPGIHALYPVTQLRLRELWSQLDSAKALNHFPELSGEEEKRVLSLLRFKSTSVESRTGSLLLHDFIGDAMASDKIAAFLALKREEYPVAIQFFRSLKEAAGKEEQVRYYDGYLALARQLSKGCSLQESHRLLRYLYPAPIADRIAGETQDFQGILQRVFPKIDCFDCEHCPIAGTSCEYPAVRENLRKIKIALGKSTVSQEALLETLMAEKYSV